MQILTHSPSRTAPTTSTCANQESWGQFGIWAKYSTPSDKAAPTDDSTPAQLSLLKEV